MSRRLIAALACRVDGSRLYGKPLQRLSPETTILAQIVAAVRTYRSIEATVLGISEGIGNLVFADLARPLNCSYALGDPEDVLARLISCGRLARATDIFRVTTECPFFGYSMLEEAWDRHVSNGNDITVLDQVPLGTGFEIYTLESLERSHAEGLASDRSEFVSNYARFNQDRFEIEILEPPTACRRPDLRLTVDYPEDLVVCRAAFQALERYAPRIPLEAIIEFLDSRPDLTALVAPYVNGMPTWAGQPQRT